MKAVFSKLKIKKVRENTGLSQRAFADAIGVTKQTISNIETGRHSPSLETILKIINYSKMPITEFME